MQKADSNSSAGASADSSTKDDATFVSSNDAKTNVVGIPDELEKAASPSREPVKVLSINYYCQKDKDKNVFASLSDDEQKQISIIIKKLAVNGAWLGINYDSRYL